MILDNPFHVLGLPADCTVREKARREAQVKAFLRVRRPLVFEDDLYFEGCRRNEITVMRALSALIDVPDRIGFGLFWFTGHGDNPYALFRLRQGDLRGALAVWEGSEDRLPTRRNAASLNNLGTLCLLIALMGESPGQRWQGAPSERIGYLRRGLRAKARLVGRLRGPDLSAFCATFSDKIAARDTEDIAGVFRESLQEFVEEARKYGLELPRGLLGEILELGGNRLKPLGRVFAGKPRKEIEQAIGTCTAACETDGSQAGAAGEGLMRVAERELPGLATLVSTKDIVYASLADRVAEALLRAAVANFNYHADKSTVLKAVRTSVSLVRYSRQIACAAAMRGKAQENLDTVRRLAKDLIAQQEMVRVRQLVQGWLERSRGRLEDIHRPRVLIASLRTDLGDAPPSTEETPSALDLLAKLKRQGTAALGPGFSVGDEMVEVASMVCSMLVNHAVAAYNSSATAQSREAMEAVELLRRIKRYFRPMRHSGWKVDARGAAERSWRPAPKDTFLVNDKCWNYLTRNLNLAAAPAPVQSGQAGGGVEKRGCLAWAGGIMGVLVLLMIIGETGDDASSRPLQFSRPPVGADRVLSLPELRWCVREDNRIERARGAYAMSQVETDRFNERVADYNSRCARKSYRPEHLERARREVEGVSP